MEGLNSVPVSRETASGACEFLQPLVDGGVLVFPGYFQGVELASGMKIIPLSGNPGA